MRRNVPILTLFFCAIVISIVILVNVKLLVGVTKAAGPAEEASATLFGTVSHKQKRDCDKETVYAVLDEQCATVCAAPGTFRSKNGLCINDLVFDKTAVTNKCDAKKGVLAYLVGDPEFGSASLLCLSVDVGIQPDNVDLPNRICTGGSVDIDYNVAFPQYTDCRCPDGRVLVRLEATQTVRDRGVCVPAAASVALVDV